MDKAKSILYDVDKIIYDKLHDGFNYNEISEIACMIQDVKTIEGYIHECTEKELDTDIKWLLKNIEDELKAADKYRKKWQKTQNIAYKGIGKEELKHAEQLMSLAQKENKTKEEQVKLNEISESYRKLVVALA